MTRLRLCILVLVVCFGSSTALDNGVALTPPMGWLSWERFECNTNCDVDPDNCISERLVKEMADAFISGGYKDAGYEFVALDDCWLSRERDEQGHLQPDPQRFPSGLKALADYVHQRGLKLGIYEDVGTKTCAGYPGCEGHYEQDAQTMAEWGVDMLKFDGCNADVDQYNIGFPEMGRALNATGRHIVYSCEWPMYMRAHGAKPDQPLIAKTCNMMRQLTDIYDSWGSVIGMIDYFGDDPDNFSAVAGPGAWNDPDQVVIGDFGLSDDQERVQMAMFSMLASPLMVSADFRNMRQSSRDILLNKHVIAIDQDPLGIQAKRVKQMDKISIWTRPVVPKGSYAIAVLNTVESGSPVKVTFTLADIGIPQGTYDITEVFEDKDIGQFRSSDQFSCRVDPTGVFLMKAKPASSLKFKTLLNTLFDDIFNRDVL